MTISTTTLLLILFALLSFSSGLVGFTKSLAKEVASRNIRVNMVAPGFIDTDMISNLRTENFEIERLIPLGRYGKTHEVAEVVCLLVETPYITGQVQLFNFTTRHLANVEHNHSTIRTTFLTSHRCGPLLSGHFFRS